MDFNTFISTIEGMGIVVSESMKQQFLSYKNLIQEVNQHLNLTAIDDDAGIYHKHFVDSLLIHPLIHEGDRVVDIGSGAGFPGIVLAIARPDISITCVEPTTKRTNFLEQVVTTCDLHNVTIYNARAEDIIEENRETFDVVTARAVAHLDMLSELCIPFIRVGGRFIAMKGQRGMEEYVVSKKAIATLGAKLLHAHEFNDDIMGVRYNLEFEKNKKTPKQYPRSYAKIKKTPLSGRSHD